MPGPFREAFTMPRWLLVLLTALGTLAATSASLGWRARGAVAANATTMQALGRVDSLLAFRVDTLRRDVDSLRSGRGDDSKILRSLAVLRCLDGTPRRLTQASGLPCATLLDKASR